AGGSSWARTHTCSIGSCAPRPRKPTNPPSWSASSRNRAGSSTIAADEGSARDLDRARLGRLGLRGRDREHAVRETGLEPVGVGVGGQRERAREPPVAALGPAAAPRTLLGLLGLCVLLGLFALLELSALFAAPLTAVVEARALLARDREHVLV